MHFPASPYPSPIPLDPDPPRCHVHGTPMVLIRSNNLYYNDGNPRLFYVCTNELCSASCRANQNGSLISTPANQATRDARSRAHRELDQLWQRRKGRFPPHGGMTRREAYRLVQEVMGLPEAEAHVGLFSIEQCEKLTQYIAERRRSIATAKRVMRRRCGR